MKYLKLLMAEFAYFLSIVLEILVMIALFSKEVSS